MSRKKMSIFIKDIIFLAILVLFFVFYLLFVALIMPY
ncbi:hypothetical protein ASN18_0726 [Candidatus Magnetominusculus xianensis]|uniref:Secreted protein n=1 Tax=Candidatus Magnetominusculus xianensis TaxID=1748249 RepID=A0ABR5SHW4_9BACT|nr:hypothetical protein ASN18_0726 [Candidatus Magnetominusculus xianensis]